MFRLEKELTKPLCFFAYISLLMIASIPSLVNAKDIVIVNVGESPQDNRIFFKNELVKLALEITKETYGEYEIVENSQRMNISRAFRELEKGENLTLTFAHTREEFEQKALVVRVPLRRGIDAFRLLVVKKGQEKNFSNIKSLEELKPFKVGLSPNWSTYKIMQENGFDIVDSPNYATMLKMLERGRFDFVPRALNEVYDELKRYQAVSDGLVVVPDIALYIPSVSFMFVSPKEPRIFQRLNSGLHAMSINGQLQDLLDKYHRDSVLKAKIQNRHIITLEHSEFPVFIPHEPLLKECDCAK
ncbi:amino acid ABC transporter substrate-binding protein [Aliiglaciecola sp. M165]|nr:amino acid ABC transporter substrate-binding protein [Aliiglaciecola sp. M165]